MPKSPAVAIPITTRGIGFYVNLHYEFCLRTLGDDMSCTVHQMYRVTLSQLDDKLQSCLKAGYKFDRKVDVTYPTSRTATEFSNDFIQENFRAVSKAISSLGCFVLNGIAYQPYVPAMPEDQNDLNGRMICDPYLVTMSNLKSVVDALSNCNTPLNERVRFQQRNAIPGAYFSESSLLLNADEIMPDNYDVDAARQDFEDFMSMMIKVRMRTNMKELVERIQFHRPGHMSILATVHHPPAADFHLENGRLHYSFDSTIRTYQPMNRDDAITGCVNLMNEYPITAAEAGEKDWKRWAIRSEYLSTGVFHANWMMVVESATDELF